MIVVSFCGPIAEIDALLNAVNCLNGVRIAPGRFESWTDGTITIAVMADVDADAMKKAELRSIEKEAEP